MTVAAQRAPGSLLRVLGVGFGLAVTIGNTIGAGILRTPGEVAAQLPSVAAFLAVWVVGALYALLGANALAELGTMVPRSGGQYVLVREGLGAYPSFVVGWSDWLSTCGTSAAVALVIAEYGGALVPQLEPWERGVAIAMVAAFALLQWRGVRWGSGAQAVTSLAKTAAFALLIGACFLLGDGMAAPTAAAHAFPPMAAILIALQAVIYTYDGWTGVLYFSEEVRDPARDIPASMFGGVAAVAVIYLLVNVSFLWVVPLERLAGESLAAAVVARELFGAGGDTVLRVLTIVSLLSALNACQLMATRVVWAMAGDRFVPQALARVNAGGTPTAALAAGTAVAIAFVAAGGFASVIAVLSFFFVANYALSFLALFRLRAREPQRPRPYRARGHPWTTGLALAGSLAFLGAALVTDPRGSAVSLAVLALSAPAYLAVRRRKARAGF